MNSRLGAALTALVLAVAMSLTAVAKERIKTDGKNKNSPIKVTRLDFSDGGGSSVIQPDLYPIRVSAAIQNTSKEDDLQNVMFHLLLKNGADEVVQDFKKSVGTLKAGASYSLEPDPYYNYNRIPLHAEVLVEHDPIEKKEDKKPDGQKQ